MYFHVLLISKTEQKKDQYLKMINCTSETLREKKESSFIDRNCREKEKRHFLVDQQKICQVIDLIDILTLILDKVRFFIYTTFVFCLCTKKTINNQACSLITTTAALPCFSPSAKVTKRVPVLLIGRDNKTVALSCGYAALCPGDRLTGDAGVSVRTASDAAFRQQQG